MKTYKDLVIWQKSIDLAIEVYRLTKQFPSEKKQALSDQLKRAAVSIPSNIAEGRSRKSDKEFTQFLYVARGSKSEVETQLYLACKLGYVKFEEAQKAFDLCEEISKMCTKLISQNEQ